MIINDKANLTRHAVLAI